jgi:hypothetical protein
MQGAGLAPLFGVDIFQVIAKDGRRAGELIRINKGG